MQGFLGKILPGAKRSGAQAWRFSPKPKAPTLQQRSIPELPLRLNGDDQRMRYGEDRIEMEVNGKETDSDEKVKNLIACHTIR